MDASRTLPRLLLPTLVVALSACAPPPPPPPDLAALEAEVRAASAALVAAETARDVEGALAHWAPDAILQASGMPQANGTEELRAAYGWLFSDEAGITEFQSTLTAVSLAASGDMAWEYGVNRMVLTTPGGPAVDAGKYMAVWVKRDGAWKVAAVAASSDAPAPVPMAADSAAAAPGN